MKKCIQTTMNQKRCMINANLYSLCFLNCHQLRNSLIILNPSVYKLGTDFWALTMSNSCFLTKSGSVARFCSVDDFSSNEVSKLEADSLISPSRISIALLERKWTTKSFSCRTLLWLNGECKSCIVNHIVITYKPNKN